MKALVCKKGDLSDLRDGDILCILDATETAALSEYQKSVFYHFLVTDEQEKYVNSLNREITVGKTTVHYGATVNMARLKLLLPTEKLDYINPYRITPDAPLDLRGIACDDLVIDKLKMPVAEVLRSATIEDLKSIASGTCTVGTGGNYARWQLFAADIAATFTTLVATQISGIAETASSSIANKTGASLTLNGNGYLVTGNVYNHTLLAMYGNVPSILNVNNFRYAVPGTAVIEDVYQSLFSTTGFSYNNDCTLNINGLIIDNRGVYKRRGIYLQCIASTTGLLTINASKLIILNAAVTEGDTLGVGLGFSAVAGKYLLAAATIENSAFIGCGKTIEDYGTIAKNFKNCYFSIMSNLSGTTTYCNYCATSRAQALAAFGSNNLSNKIAATEFESLDPTAGAAFLRPKRSGVLYKSGALPTLSTTDYNGKAWRTPYPIGPNMAIGDHGPSKGLRIGLGLGLGHKKMSRIE